jgi:hypothetical protein
MRNEKLSFANRLKRGQDTLILIRSKKEFKTFVYEISVEGFGAFIDELIDYNRYETAAMAQYLKKAHERRMYFFDGPDSVMKTMQAIKAVVRIKYGKDSTYFKILKNIMDRMKYERGRRKKSSETAEENKPKPRKRGEKTSSTLTKNFNDFIITTKDLTDFWSSFTLYDIESLEQRLEKMNQLNSEVLELESKLLKIKSERRKLYSELRSRMGRIEAYFISLFGRNSTEHLIMKDLLF